MADADDGAGYREACEIAEALLDGFLTSPATDWSAIQERAVRLAEIAEQHQKSGTEGLMMNSGVDTIATWTEEGA